MFGLFWPAICTDLKLYSCCRSFSNLQGWVIGLSNSYGLLFVVFLLGPGLVELPVKSVSLVIFV